MTTYIFRLRERDANSPTVELDLSAIESNPALARAVLEYGARQIVRDAYKDDEALARAESLNNGEDWRKRGTGAPSAGAIVNAAIGIYADANPKAGVKKADRIATMRAIAGDPSHVHHAALMAALNAPDAAGMSPMDRARKAAELKASAKPATGDESPF